MLWQMLLAIGILGIVTLAYETPDRDPQAGPAFVCNLGALTPDERKAHQEMTRRLLDAIVATREIATGYAFELQRDRLSLVDLATWVERERRCCPFFDFGLDLRREEGPLTLRLTGPEGVKAFIVSELRESST